MRLKWSPMGKSYDLLSLIFVFQKISVRKCIEISLVNLSWILRFLSSPTESPTVNSRRGGGTLGISGWGCTAGTLEPLIYTRASSAKFCYAILE